MSTRALLEDLKTVYSQLVICDDKTAILPAGIDTEINIDADKPVKEWVFYNKKDKKAVEPLAMSEMMKVMRQDLAEIWFSINERSGDTTEPRTKTPEKVEEVVEGVYDEEATKAMGEQPKKEQWSKPVPKNQTKTEVIETVNLPAPVGVGGIVRPAVTAAEALAAWNEFQALKNCIINKTDLQRINGKDFVKKSGWRKFATFYNLTDKIVEETRTNLENGGFQWKMKVLCRAPNGRETEGVAICTSIEKKFAHPEHDVYTTCHTRAKNRAISDMIAAGEVSAEEVEA